MRESWYAAVAVAAVCSAVGAGLLAQDLDDVAVTPAPTSAQPSSGRVAPGGTGRDVESGPFDRTVHSTAHPSSIWVVVNKANPIEPADFRPEVALVRGYQVAIAAAGPLERLLVDADRLGLGFKIASAFRSYDYQREVHAATVASRGRAAADRVSARAGHSEHQTGLAVDLVTPADPACDFEACFAETPGGRWLASEAWRYGFVVRYRPGSTAITGYSPEPWHLRYVGRGLAAELRRTGVGTLEEFFGVAGGDYRTG
ncbi:M15 family metallopeptidase [Nocardioides ferulae]|uniref:M15 family metallopeptidase n=1 Tax=Nocardioides ferulae TaxID=2340821 RepID=UPI0013DDC9AF|nr:M15 family metallopeptidase [Nocardioides ferulae]